MSTFSVTDSDIFKGTNILPTHLLHIQEPAVASAVKHHMLFLLE